MKHFLFFILLLSPFVLLSQNNKKVVVFQINQEINPTATRIVSKSIAKAKEEKADLILLEMNTYGGLLTEADSIRQMILNLDIPIYAFINKNAASAGAIISIACDKIFMAPGASIGAATAVNQDGGMAPDKIQAYTRSMMRSTAESHGKDTVITDGDTLIRFIRNPMIAEAMVDASILVPGIIDSGRIIAFSTADAIQHRYCEGEVKDINQLLINEGYVNPEIISVTQSTLDKLIGFLSGPVIRGMLIMFIFWGIFFEIRTPGVGFPLLAAIISALVYFAPLYLDGLAANWEILIFILGMILIILEIFVIPGFGVAGISGIVLTITGLILSLIRNINFDFSGTTPDEVNGALTIVFVSMVGFIVGLIIFGKGLMNSPLSKKIVLSTTLKDARVGAPNFETGASLIGEKGIAHTDIRPMGKIKISENIVDCKSHGEFIEEGKEVRIIARELGYWVVEKV